MQGNPRASRLLGPMCSKSSTGYIQTTVRTDPPRARQRQGLEFSRLLNTSGDPVCPLISADLVRGNARASRLFSSALMCSKCSTGYIQTTVRIDPPRARQRQGLEISRLLSTSGDTVCPLISADLVRGNTRASRFLDREEPRQGLVRGNARASRFSSIGYIQTIVRTKGLEETRLSTNHIHHLARILL